MPDDKDDNDLTYLLTGLLKKAFSGAADDDAPGAGPGLSFGKLLLPVIMMLFGFGADGTAVAKTGDLAEHAGAAAKQTASSAPAAHQPGSRAIVLLGDSLTDGEAGALSKHFGNVVNLAKVGAHLSYIDDSKIAEVPKGAAVIMDMGVNDIVEDKTMSAADVDAYARHLVDRAAQVRNERGADVTINTVAVRDAGPVWAANIKAINDAVKRHADENHIPITDVADVGEWANTLHKTPAGYEQMAGLGLKTLGLTA